MSQDWQKCLDLLDHELTAAEFNTMILPIQCKQDDDLYSLYFPNEYLLNAFAKNHLGLVEQALSTADGKKEIKLQVGSIPKPVMKKSDNLPLSNHEREGDDLLVHHNLNPQFILSNYIKGTSNEVATAAANQVAKNPGVSYNPLVIYGAVGLGKTHLMHAIGHEICAANPEYKIAYVHSERFVSEMIRALQTADMESFKHRYRSLDVLLIDDIQFFAKKERSQEELFHTVNTLLDSGQQTLLTSDRYPK